MVTFTDEAIQMAENMSLEENNAGLALRVYLDGKGCDGFFYGVAFDDKSNDDHSFQVGQITVVIDPESLKFLKGSNIEWVDDERGKGFLVDNPSQRKFRGKFYKKKNWEERLLT